VLVCTNEDHIASLLDLQNRYSPLRNPIRFHSCWLKGQSHEKVGEMRVQGDSLGPN
jgi:hypothetical protein